MKILLATENLGSGGAERQLTGLAALLAAKGHQCVVVTWIDKNFYASYLKENNVRHIMLRPKGRFDRVKKLAAMFRSERPDAVISFLPMANETAALASLLVPVKLIVSERSFTTKWGWRRRLTNLLYRRAAYVVANSNNEGRNIAAHCRSLAPKIKIIPNFVETERFMHVKHEPGRPTRIVSVGRIIPSKNIEGALKTLRVLCDRGYQFTLDWYGGYYMADYYNSVVALRDELGLTSIVTFKGENKAIEAALPNYDIFFFPSLLEGYPNVLCEAMACGLPAASSNVCEMPEILSDGKGGCLFDPTDVTAMADALARLIDSSPETLSSMGQYNRRFIVDNNSETTFVNKYLELL